MTPRPPVPSAPTAAQWKAAPGPRPSTPPRARHWLSLRGPAAPSSAHAGIAPGLKGTGRAPVARLRTRGGAGGGIAGCRHGREGPPTKWRRERSVAAKPPSCGVERGGRQRCHLQRVPLQGLQSGFWIYDQSSSPGRETGPSPRMVQCLQQGSYNLKHP